jgi:deoxyxylulose-5-phosphate synthase
MSTAVKKEHKSARPERGGQATLVEAIRQGIWEEMERDPTVFVIGEDVGAYGGAFKVTDGLIDQFGKERVIDTPISEGAIVGAACGAALMGMRPVAEFQFIDFISAGFVIAGVREFRRCFVVHVVRECVPDRFIHSTPNRFSSTPRD